MWTQIVGKTRLQLARWQNHWWHVTLHVTAKGLGTGVMPYGDRSLDIEFDFVEHELVLRTSEGLTQTIKLEPMSVADFYEKYMFALDALEMPVSLWPVPVEIDHQTRFPEDTEHCSYDGEAVNRFWRVLAQVDDVLKQFRSSFIGKVSPVHFFWGSFDLCVSRFSGERAPPRAEADRITEEAYSHAVISAGFWPGSGPVQEASFYAYAAPVPDGFSEAKPLPAAAYYNKDLGEFLLPYEAVRTSASPADTLMEFLQSTYAAAADLAGWPRAKLETS
jgi:hypothetical protein